MQSARSVLIVDDEEVLLEGLAAAVRGRGHSVKTALNGRQALEILEDSPCDLVVTDLKMPVLDGPSLISEILNNGYGARVIVVTGYATLESAIDCLRKGAVDFLVKPFEVEVFLRSVEKALDGLAPAKPQGGEVDWETLSEEFDLTRRQVATLRALYNSGRSNRDLAEDLCLSLDTVKSHLRTGFHKLGVANRAQFFHRIKNRPGSR